jgi:hypothetical protein
MCHQNSPGEEIGICFHAARNSFRKYLAAKNRGIATRLDKNNTICLLECFSYERIRVVYTWIYDYGGIVFLEQSDQACQDAAQFVFIFAFECRVIDSNVSILAFRPQIGPGSNQPAKIAGTAICEYSARIPGQNENLVCSCFEHGLSKLGAKLASVSRAVWIKNGHSSGRVT